MKKGFTIIEALMAVSVFALAAVLSSSILIDVVQMQKKTVVQTQVYEDIRIILQTLTNEIHSGNIDYEEYYSVNVAQVNAATALSGQSYYLGPYYGINYGVYASRFYNPGQTRFPGSGLSPGTNPDDLGIECSYPSSISYGETCEVYLTDSTDFNTGQNPYKNSSSDPATADAFCDNGIGHCSTPVNHVNELYLINRSGTQKTIIGRKLVNTGPDYALAMVKMDGSDLDQNGVIDVFTCSPEFSCQSTPSEIFSSILYPFVQNAGQNFISQNNISLPKQSDLNTLFSPSASDFAPISPFRTSIKDLRFIIEPIEDPFKAFAEDEIQGSPTVTIILTVGLSSDAAANYPGLFRDVTVQTTIATGALAKIDSYPPVSDVLGRSTDTSWISDALPPGVN